MSVWIELSFISQEDDDLFPADGRAALDKLSEEDEDYSEVSIFSVEKTTLGKLGCCRNLNSNKQTTNQILGRVKKFCPGWIGEFSLVPLRSEFCNTDS